MEAEFEQDSYGVACNVIWYSDRSRAGKIIIKISPPTSSFYKPAKTYTPCRIRKVRLLAET
jgi:hypothetical protein